MSNPFIYNYSNASKTNQQSQNQNENIYLESSADFPPLSSEPLKHKSQFSQYKKTTNPPNQVDQQSSAKVQTSHSQGSNLKSSSFTVFEQRTLKANPHALEEARFYIESVQKAALDLGYMFTADWDAIPVHVFPSKHQNTALNNFTQKDSHKSKRARENVLTKKKKIKYRPPSPSGEKIYSDYIPKTIIGTSTTLEKQYFRSADDPDPATIRPEYILKQSFQLIKRKAREGAEWAYVSNQLKSIRQDMVIQGIKNEFSVEVYETHARFCLDHQDFQEYHRCQGKLIELYHDGIEGSLIEFLAYRILYTIYTENTIEMNGILEEINEQVWSHFEITHAMCVREAVALKNWHQFFKLYETCPNKGKHIMAHMLKSIRLSSIKMIYHSIRPKVPIAWIEKELGFESRTDCIDYLKLIKAKTIDQYVETKESLRGLKEYLTQQD